MRPNDFIRKASVSEGAVSIVSADDAATAPTALSPLPPQYPHQSEKCPPSLPLAGDGGYVVEWSREFYRLVLSGEINRAVSAPGRVIDLSRNYLSANPNCDSIWSDGLICSHWFGAIRYYWEFYRATTGWWGDGPYTSALRYALVTCHAPLNDRIKPTRVSIYDALCVLHIRARFSPGLIAAVPISPAPPSAFYLLKQLVGLGRLRLVS